jgi:hypothetical protein
MTNIETWKCGEGAYNKTRSSLLEGSNARTRFPAGDEPLLRTATDLFGDQALGLTAAHVELVHIGLSQNEKKNCKFRSKFQSTQNFLVVNAHDS